MIPPLVIERPQVRLTKAQPLAILSDCKRAALKAGVSLQFWVEFRATFDACLSPDCEPEEMEKALLVVEERFDVTKAEGFSLEVPTKAKDE